MCLIFQKSSGRTPKCHLNGGGSRIGRVGGKGEKVEVAGSGIERRRGEGGEQERAGGERGKEWEGRQGGFIRRRLETAFMAFLLLKHI